MPMPDMDEVNSYHEFATKAGDPLQGQSPGSSVTPTERMTRVRRARPGPRRQRLHHRPGRHQRSAGQDSPAGLRRTGPTALRHSDHRGRPQWQAGPGRSAGHCREDQPEGSPYRGCRLLPGALGEFVLVVAGAPEASRWDEDRVRAALQAEIEHGASAAEAARAVAEISGWNKRAVYALLNKE